jgi:hypothetical protein
MKIFSGKAFPTLQMIGIIPALFLLVDLAVVGQGVGAQPSQEVVNQRVSEIMQHALQRGVGATAEGIRITPMRADASLQEMDEVKSFGSRAIAPLSVYLDGPDYRAQHLAVRILGYIGGKSVIAPLTKAAEHSPSAMVRLAALECLGQQPWDDIEKTVRLIFSNDADPLLHKQAKQMIEAHTTR